MSTRRLAAILAADVVGYSRLMGADEEGTLDLLKAHRRETIDPKIAEHRGRIVKTTGDGLLVEFASAVDAVRCAIELQRDLAERGIGTSPDKRIEIRIGIHVGDIIFDGDDIFGDGVNIAARLEGIAEPGGITISGTVYDQVRDRFANTLEDRGEQAMKNIAHPVRVYRVRVGAAVAASPPAMPPSADVPLTLPDKPSIAVLPFQNMSGDPEQEYFADGMVEEITTALSRLRWLFVIARNSSFTYKGKAVDVKQVGRDLGVRYVLEGSVRKAGNRVRITAQLIDAGSGTHLWADKFDGTLDDIFDLHDQVAMEVAGAVEPSLREAEIDRSLRKPTTSLDAYDLYMRGLAAFRDLSPDNLRLALTLTAQAIDLDPRFARALALRAMCLQHLHTDEREDPEAVSEALRLAHAALAASSDDWEAASIAAMVIALMGGSIDTALAASQRALMLNPSGFLALVHNGWIHCAAGSPEAAIDPFTRALRLSPRDPLRGYCELGLAVAHRDLGHPTVALAWGRAAILSPLLAGGYRTAAVALVDLGRIDEARELIGQLLKALPRARLRPELIRRQNRNAATVEAWIAALRRAGLPE